MIWLNGLNFLDCIIWISTQKQNQILKGLKQKPPATASGRLAGSYIPRPDLPKMADYDSNKTYLNIG